MAGTATDDLLGRLTSGEPDWLSELRRSAWAAHRTFTLPTGREEVWRYTDVATIDPAGFDPSPRAGIATAEFRSVALDGIEPAARAFDTVGAEAAVQVSDEAAAAGVVVMPMAQAVREHADLLRARLGSLVGADDYFTSLAMALQRGGLFVHVPRGVRVHGPIQSLYTAGWAGGAVFPRTVVVVEDGADVVFNDVYASGDGGEPMLVAPVTELFVGHDARVGWVTWQDHAPGVRHLAHVKAHLDRSAVLNTLLVTLGGDFSRTWKECVLAGEGSESVMLGLYFPHGSQRFEHWTVQDHVAPHTRSDLLYKGALADEARAVYYGTIRVRHEAKKTDAYQANRNLTLSPRAKADTNPQLEIETNDVRCTHGATVGRVDDDQMFYMMSRGIPRPEAERLLVFGFFNEVLGRVEWSGMHERLAEAIQAKVSAQSRETRT